MACTRCVRHYLCIFHVSQLILFSNNETTKQSAFFFSYLLVIFAQYVLITVIFIPDGDVVYKVINIVIFEFFTFLAFCSHLRTMFTDPVCFVVFDFSKLIIFFVFQGAVPRGTATKEAIEQLGLIDGQVLYKCTKCSSIKPERAHHCSVCQRCIRKMDHHCPWVNNCVGENNQKFFVLFTVSWRENFIISLTVLFFSSMWLLFRFMPSSWYSIILWNASTMTGNVSYTLFHMHISLTLLYLITIVDSNSTACGTAHKDPKSGLMVSSPTPLNVILLICLVFEGLLFAIFTCIMFGVQMQAIWNDETGIEHLKKESGKRWNRRQRWRSMRAVFGLKGFSISWFSPFTRVESNAVLESANYTVWPEAPEITSV